MPPALWWRPYAHNRLSELKPRGREAGVMEASAGTHNRVGVGRSVLEAQRLKREAAREGLGGRGGKVRAKGLHEDVKSVPDP